MAEGVLEVELLSGNGIMPQKAHEGDAGYDLFASESGEILARSFAKVPTDIALSVPDGTYGRIAPRSSLALKGIDVGAGVVDATYQGHVKIVLFNHSDQTFKFNKGDRVAQLILEKIATQVTIKQVQKLSKPSERGTKGFGSSGTSTIHPPTASGFGSSGTSTIHPPTGTISTTPTTTTSTAAINHDKFLQDCKNRDFNRATIGIVSTTPTTTTTTSIGLNPTMPAGLVQDPEMESRLMQINPFLKSLMPKDANSKDINDAITLTKVVNALVGDNNALMKKIQWTWGSDELCKEKNIIESKRCGRIVALTGPMFASKTTALSAFIRRYTLAKKQCLVVKYLNDNRYSSLPELITHDQVKITASYVTACLNKIPEHLLSSTDVLLIDEAHFYDDLVEFCVKMAMSGKVVICAGLVSTWDQKPFTNMCSLIAHADQICAMKAVCTICGEDAIYTKRLTNSTQLEIIGGTETYTARCRSCFHLP